MKNKADKIIFEEWHSELRTCKECGKEFVYDFEGWEDCCVLYECIKKKLNKKYENS